MSLKYILFAPLLVLVLAGCGSDDPTPEARDGAPLTGDTLQVDRAGIDTLDETFPEPPPLTREENVEVNGTGPDGSRAGSSAPDASRETSGRGQPSAASGDASAIVRRVEQRYAPVRTLRAEFVQRLDVPLLGSEQVSRGTLYQQQPNLLAMRFSDPEGDLVVADGRYLWMYQPSEDPRQVMRTRLADGAAPLDFHREFLEGAEDRFRVSLEGGTSVQGRATHVLRLIPRTAASYRRVRIWVDRESYDVLRFEVEEDNETVRRIDLRNVRTNVDIPGSVFEFSPPAGVSVFEP